MSNQLVKIPFHGADIEVVDIDGKPFVSFRPLAESIGLDSSSQLAKLRSRSWANRRDIPSVAADGKLRVMAVVDVPTLTMWLAGVNETKVSETARPLLVAYQRESAEAIYGYWIKGQAINPRNAMEKFFEPNTLTWEEAAALVHQRTGVPVVVNDVTRLLRSGGVLKQTGAPTKAFRHWFWFTGSAWNVHPHIVQDMIYKVFSVGRDLQDSRFTQARLDFEPQPNVVPMQRRRQVPA